MEKKQRAALWFQRTREMHRYEVEASRSQIATSNKNVNLIFMKTFSWIYGSGSRMGYAEKISVHCRWLQYSHLIKKLPLVLFFVIMFVCSCSDNHTNDNCDELLNGWNKSTHKSLDSQQKLFSEDKLRLIRIIDARSFEDSEFRKETVDEWLCKKNKAIEEKAGTIYLLEMRTSGEANTFKSFVEIQENELSTYYYFTSSKTKVIPDSIESSLTGLVKDLYMKNDFNSRQNQTDTQSVDAIVDYYLVTAFTKEGVNTKCFTGESEAEFLKKHRNCSKILELIYAKKRE
jgi:hypothetical protein